MHKAKAIWSKYFHYHLHIYLFPHKKKEKVQGRIRYLSIKLKRWQNDYSQWQDPQYSQPLAKLRQARRYHWEARASPPKPPAANPIIFHTLPQILMEMNLDDRVASSFHSSLPSDLIWSDQQHLISAPEQLNFIFHSLLLCFFLPSSSSLSFFISSSTNRLDNASLVTYAH